MGNLADALHKAGLIDEQQRQLAELEHAARNPERRSSFSGLDGCQTATSMNEFKRSAKEMLLRDPGSIDEVIRLAHRFKDGTPAGKRFIWLFYELRDQMKAHAGQEADIIRRALRRHGSGFKSE